MILTDLCKIKDLKHKVDKGYLLDQLAKTGNAELLTIIFDKDVRFFVNTSAINPDSEPSIFQKTDEELNSELLNLLKVLASEEIRGKEAERACSDFAYQLYSQKEFDMFLNILENKTRLGIGATDINKYCDGFKIEQFEVMFAKRLDKVKNVDWNQSWYVQPKIDGNRCICIIDMDNINFYTRTGKEITSLESVKESLQEIFGKCSKCVLDGEIENGSLEETGIIRRKTEQAENAIYTIFGIYPLDEWNNKSFTENYETIYNELDDILNIAHKQHYNIRIIPSFEIAPTSEDQFHELVQTYTNKFIQQGYEGSVIKTLNHTYNPSTGTRRSNDWLKIKPSLDSDGIVIEIIQGDGEWKNRAGKFKVKWLDKTFEVAPGKFTKDQCEEIWINSDLYIGKKLEFQYQCLSIYGVPRHAFAVKFRND